jgi:hypothetical protein
MIIDFTPTEEAQLEAAARREGIDPAELVRKLVTERLEEMPRDAWEDPTLALFARWDREDAAMTAEEIEEAKREAEEFKRNINAERTRAGSRIMYP